MTFPCPRGETYKKMWKNPRGKPTPHLFASYQAERLGAPPCLGARNLGCRRVGRNIKDLDFTITHSRKLPFQCIYPLVILHSLTIENGSFTGDLWWFMLIYLFENGHFPVRYVRFHQRVKTVVILTMKSGPDPSSKHRSHSRYGIYGWKWPKNCSMIYRKMVDMFHGFHHWNCIKQKADSRIA